MQVLSATLFFKTKINGNDVNVKIMVINFMGCLDVKYMQTLNVQSKSFKIETSWKFQ